MCVYVCVQEKIAAEPAFAEFVARSSLIVERLLGRDEVFDVFVVSLMRRAFT